MRHGPRNAGRRALGTRGGSAKPASETGETSSVCGALAPASARKRTLYLMHVAKKLPLPWNALRRPFRPHRSRMCSRPATRGDRVETYKVVLSPSTSWTRVLVSHGPDELLRAILPPPTRMRHERAVTTFLEGLSLWLDEILPVVLSVDARQASFCLGLTDELGLGARSVYYRVEVSERGRRQRRGTRIRGVGDFGDLRQLRLVPDPVDR